MFKIIQKIKENVALTILTALLLGTTVFLVSQQLSQWTVSIIEKYIELASYMSHAIFKLYILLLSILMIWLVNNRSFTNYGFVKPKKINYLKMILITTGVVLGSIIIGQLIFMELLEQKPSSKMMDSVSKMSITQTILGIWIWSSITEEFLSRGLVQGFMQHLKHIKFLGLSLSVIFSGLFFGALHLSTGMGIIVFITTLGGFVMAYYREKSGSILPAIYVHVLSNVVGATLAFLSTM